MTEKPTTGVAPGFEWSDGPAGRVLVSTALAAQASHAFTTRERDFRGASESDDWAALAAQLGVGAGRIARVRQVHGRTVIMAGPDQLSTSPPEADALVSIDPATAVAVRIADCVPILIADRQGRAVAAVHAGWRGTLEQVTAATIDVMRELGAPAEHLTAALGPSIGPCCYQVDARVHDAFLGRTPEASSWFEDDGPGHWRLDLWKANVDQLQAKGVSAAAIHVARYCTAHHLADCFSFRREGDGVGRMVAAIRLGPRR